jgi:hypothetical protein
VHFHSHSHGDGVNHIHVHSHAGETTAHASSAPAHAHAHSFRWRTLLVGLMHGMAGSAALLVLAVSQAASPATAIAYVLLFGLGSMLGMGALSAVIAVPLAVSAVAYLGQPRAAGGGRGGDDRGGGGDDLGGGVAHALHGTSRYPSMASCASILVATEVRSKRRESTTQPVVCGPALV